MHMNARLVQADQSVSDAYECKLVQAGQSVSDAYECKVGPGRSECV